METGFFYACKRRCWTGALLSLPSYPRSTMNIPQLEYIIALNHYKSFSLAASKCNVTQPTLSTQVKRLEEELGVVIFDRGKHPLEPTDVGEEIIDQARKTIGELKGIQEIVKGHKNVVTGDLKIGIIPTLAPYLVPMFLGGFLREYPQVKLKITEEKTENIVQGIERGEFDAGIAATPLEEATIEELPLFNEKLLCYMNDELASRHASNSVQVDDILKEKIWVLSEGNCIRNQTFNLCNMAQLHHRDLEVSYESGSIETLIRLVDQEGGSTIIPELCTLDLEEDRLDRVKFIGTKNPVRQISLITRRKGYKKRLFDALRASVDRRLPNQVKENTEVEIVPIV